LGFPAVYYTPEPLVASELSEKQSQFGKHQIQIKAKPETTNKFVRDSQNVGECVAMHGVSCDALISGVLPLSSSRT
jgi:hypothetical protein